MVFSLGGIYLSDIEASGGSFEWTKQGKEVALFFGNNRFPFCEVKKYGNTYRIVRMEGGFDDFYEVFDEQVRENANSKDSSFAVYIMLRNTAISVVYLLYFTVAVLGGMKLMDFLFNINEIRHLISVGIAILLVFPITFILHWVKL